MKRLTSNPYSNGQADFRRTIVASAGPATQPTENDPCKMPCITFGLDVLLAQEFQAVSVSPVP
jgi:hypothetical protein